MKKEIKNLKEIELTPDTKPIKIKTNIEALKVYNEKILKGEVFLESIENTPIDFYVITSHGFNQVFASLTQNSSQNYIIEKDQTLGYLVEETVKNKLK